MTVSELIDALGGPTSFGRLAGALPSAASEMKRRGSIPVRYWPAIITGARAKGMSLTNDMLVEAHVGVEQAVSDDGLSEARA